MGDYIRQSLNVNYRYASILLRADEGIEWTFCNAIIDGLKV
jgi:hypothetical protein